jgi:FkbM family methyltransferase
VTTAASAPRLADLLGIDLPAIAVLDIGARSEGRDRYAPLAAQGRARVTGVEVLPQDEAALRARGIVRLIPALLGGGGPARFHVTRYPGCSSLLEPDPTVIDLFPMIGTGPGGNFHVEGVHDITTRRLDDVLVEGLPDFIKIDVQGAELDILRHGVRALATATVIEAEVEFVALYKDQPLFGDLQAFLRDHGFVLHKLIDLVGHSLMPRDAGYPVSQLLWGDAVFVRDFTKLARYDDDDLMRAALVLNDVYQSYDLVALLLAEHDRRRGTDHAARHRAGLAAQPVPAGRFLNLKPDA